MFQHKPLYIILAASYLLVSCSVSKFIPEGEYLLDNVKIINYNREVASLGLEQYVRQTPNSKWFNLFKVPLYTYALSGTDTAKWRNRFLQRLGEKPVIYDENSADHTCEQLRQKLRNEGYLKATVEREMKIKKKKRAELVYYLNERNRYTVTRIDRNIQDSAIAFLLQSDSTATLLYEGMPFSVNRLNKERERIATLLRNRGYYKFRKEFITYTADTVFRSTEIHLTMTLPLYREHEKDTPSPHPVYTLNEFCFVSDAGLRSGLTGLQSECDTMRYHDYLFFYKGKMFIRPSSLASHTFMERGHLYSDAGMERTYRSFSRLSALKYTKIRFSESLSDSTRLDAFLLYERSKRHSLSFEIEGTNTSGDLGAAASVSFSDRNLFRGSELLTLKLRGAYEAISGLEGYTGDSYYEYGAEASLKFPGFIFPLLSSRLKNKVNVTSQISLQFNSQERPEFERQVLSAAWSYSWSTRGGLQHKVDVLDINYIYVPWISETFKREYLDSISNRNAILKYNYENLLITKFGYSFLYNSANSVRPASAFFNITLRANVETSGNLLNLTSYLSNNSKNSNGQYTFLSIAYAQYIKGDLDISMKFDVARRNSWVFHIGLGAAYPYGNSTILPFEKRYFSGGANSLRGWSVRSLGPGSFSGSDKKIDFINQSGDLRLDVNLEYRTHLFWKINTALFVDAGNIWTIRSYKEQPGGQFRLNRFYKEIAISYGLGFRLEMDFLILRLDGGMKAIHPAYTGRDKYPFLRPDFSRDFALHFAVGYPF